METNNTGFNRDINNQESLSELMRKADKEQQAAAVKYVAKKELKSPSVKAPYIMKHAAECDYFS